jgi:hypothetical protein
VIDPFVRANRRARRTGGASYQFGVAQLLYVDWLHSIQPPLLKTGGSDGQPLDETGARNVASRRHKPRILISAYYCARENSRDRV